MGGRNATQMPDALYDRIGQTYISTRRPDPRIADAIKAALGSIANSIINGGAGAGAYEPSDRPLIAVEPSRKMIQQRSRGMSPVVQAVAEALPFRTRAFDVALARCAYPASLVRLA